MIISREQAAKEAGLSLDVVTVELYERALHMCMRKVERLHKDYEYINFLLPDMVREIAYVRATKQIAAGRRRHGGARTLAGDVR